MNLYNGTEPNYDEILKNIKFSKVSSLSDEFERKTDPIISELQYLGCTKEFITKVCLEAMRRAIDAQKGD